MYFSPFFATNSSTYIFADMTYTIRETKQDCNTISLSINVTKELGKSNSCMPTSNAKSELDDIMVMPVTLKSGIYDDFEDGIYDLDIDAISPNGKWRGIGDGYGAMGVKTEEDGNNVFFINPKAPETKNATYSSLVTSVNNFSNFELTLNIRTDKQLRLHDPPNSWEAGWVFFRYGDPFHYYWLVVKSTGVELGKKDCNNCIDLFRGQIFLKQLETPTLQTGKWSTWNIQVIGNQIKVAIDGNQLIDYTDETMSDKLRGGAIALYTEDADVVYDNVYVSPLTNFTR
jgi:Domain of Unknown Function (DUF1080)